jgi:hypothetical protein
MKIRIGGNGNRKDLLNMLAWIELLGNIGHSASFKVFADGDGSTRWKFKFKNKKEQEQFDILRKELLKEYNDNHKDIQCFNI